MFSDLAARHSGHYTCIASNAAAVANYTAKLIVRGTVSMKMSYDVVVGQLQSIIHQKSYSLRLTEKAIKH